MKYEVKSSLGWIAIIIMAAFGVLFLGFRRPMDTAVLIVCLFIFVVISLFAVSLLRHRVLMVVSSKGLYIPGKKAEYTWDQIESVSLGDREQTSDSKSIHFICTFHKGDEYAFDLRGIAGGARAFSERFNAVSPPDLKLDYDEYKKAQDPWWKQLLYGLLIIIGSIVFTAICISIRK